MKQWLKKGDLVARKIESISPLFATPLMIVQLDLDLEKLTKFAFKMREEDKKGVDKSNIWGWQSDNITNNKDEEFVKLKKVINQHLQIYHSEVFRGMTFRENVMQHPDNMWININEKSHYNEWHNHLGCVLSGAFYIKHDASVENGDIMFHHPVNRFNDILLSHWPVAMVEHGNDVTSEVIKILPEPNMLVIFPAWLEHRTGINYTDNTRISLAFNGTLMPEKISDEI